MGGDLRVASLGVALAFPRRRDEARRVLPHAEPPPPLSSPRNVVVVGATGTIGGAVARALSARGDRVVLVGRRAEALDGLAAALRETSRHAPSVAAIDLADEGAAERLASTHPDATDLVFATGSFPTTPLAELTRAQLAAQAFEHCAVFIELVRALAPSIAQARGAAIAFGDDGIERPYPNHLAYLAAKGALTAAARALSFELSGAPRGPQVRVGVVAIGVVTDPDVGDPIRGQNLARRSRLGRTGAPSEVAHVALSMMDATWVTGEVWRVGR